jgi:hypothetical protein
MEMIVAQDGMFKEYCDCLEPSVRQNDCMFKDIEDRFAMWLKENEEQDLEQKSLDFFKFKAEL